MQGTATTLKSLIEMHFRFILYIAFCLLASTFLMPTALHAQERAVPDSVVTKMQKERDFLYANDSSYWKEKKQTRNNAFINFINRIANSAFLKLLLYLFLGGIILFAVYQVLVVNNFFFTSRRRKNTAAEHDDDENELTNLDEKLSAALSAQNYRQAVRYLYLQTLKRLSDRQLISLQAKATNRDYIQQLHEHQSQNEFRQLTRIYEYVWYGEFHPNESQYQFINTQFNTFNAPH